MQSQAIRVRDFTEQSKGVRVPNKPRPMTRDEVMFVVKMICEETRELLETVSDDPLRDLIDCAHASKPPQKSQGKEGNVDVLIEEQVDAFVDIMYFCHNAAAKAGMDCDQVFDVVHEANMAKRFPDGTFHCDKDGKIVKPEGWKPGDVGKIVRGWIETGTWKDRQ